MKVLTFMRIAASVGMAVAFAMGPFSPITAGAEAVNQAAITAPHAEAAVLVGFKPGTTGAERASVRRAGGAANSESLSPLARDAERLLLGPGTTVERAITNLLRNPNVLYAEPDYLLQSQVVANDTYYTNGSLWGMYGDGTTPANQYGSAAGEAWVAGYTGLRAVYVGVIDEGIQFTHPDLDANVWTNPFDPVDGIDNDGNGKIDDVHGWDFFNNDNSVYDSTADDHATHVAGTIGGEGGNAAGVAGVNWNINMISTKFLGPNGGFTSGAIKALDYLTDLKIRHSLKIVATNNSWGGVGFSQSLLDAINRSGNAGILFVAAAGNNGVNNDTTAFYPASYSATGSRGWDCVISVAAITSTGDKASFSNYGLTSVDIGAPGSAIMSTVPTNSYASYSGTSMATPHVTGAIALGASINPLLTAQQLRDLVLNSAAPTASLAGKTVTGDRLDIGAMLSQVATGSISGHVYQSDGNTPIAGASAVSSSFVEGTIYIREATTTADGSYYISGMPAGNARVFAQASGYITEYYSETSDYSQATMVPVIMSGNTPNIDFTLTVNSPPQLSGGSVGPTTGDTSTDFYYTVHYYDADGHTPGVKQLYTDDTAYSMTLYSGQAYDGTYRYGPVNLSAGGHNYHFYFEDGNGGTAREPSSTGWNYAGPTVTSGGNSFPSTPSNPSPANHATSVPANTLLSWTGGDPDAGDAVTYRVFFGSIGSPPIPHDQTATTFAPGALIYDTEYQWQVVAIDNHGASTVGPWWYFTTITAPTLESIKVTPSNPANLPVGSTQQFAATGTYGDASTKDLTAQVTWSSSDSAKATISAAGLAKGVAAGNTNITATMGAVTSPAVSLTVTNSIPTITVVTPNQGNRGQSLNIIINGTNLTGASTVSFGAGITVNSITVVSSTRITVNITINRNAKKGPRTVTVTAPGGTATKTGGFTVN
jgi:subtilisin family serine protease